MSMNDATAAAATEALVDPKAAAYLDELAADIAAHGGFGDRDPKTVIAEAHARRQAFIQEMLVQRTDRARMARVVLGASIYGTLAARGAAQTALEHCGHIADATFRQGLFNES